MGSVMVGDATTWKRVRLGDLVKIIHGWPFKSEFFTEERKGRPIIVSIGNFQYTGGFRFNSTTVKEYADDYPKDYELSPNDILLVMTCQTSGGEILGIPGRIPDDGNTYLHNQRMGKVAIKDRESVDPDFIYYLALWPEFNRELCVSASGTKILHTAPVRIEAFEFNLPPLVEQQAISMALRALDDKIELNRRMNATLETMAWAMFQSWFVDFDPVRAKFDGRESFGLDTTTAALFPTQLVETALGFTPQGWEVRSLDKAAHYLNGLALQKYPPGDGPTLPVIKIAQLRKGDTTGADRCNASLPPAYIVSDGDVLFSWSGSLEVELWCGGSGALNQHLFKVTSLEFPKWFYYLWTLYYLDEFRRIAAGKATTMGHIQRGHLTAAKVLVPPPVLLGAMTRIMSPLLDKIIANRTQSRTLTTLRDTLLPKLLSGEVRIGGSGILEQGGA
jgi:type I restriction enzyme S subunit